MIRWVVLILLLCAAAGLSGLTVAGGASFFLVKGAAFVLVLALALLGMAGNFLLRGIARLTR